MRTGDTVADLNLCVEKGILNDRWFAVVLKLNSPTEKNIAKNTRNFVVKLHKIPCSLPSQYPSLFSHMCYRAIAGAQALVPAMQSSAHQRGGVEA